MDYKIIFSRKSDKKFKKLEKNIQKRIFDYLTLKVLKNPYGYGKSLSGNISEYWRYRVGDYRILCRIGTQKRNLQIIIKFQLTF
jgi:mRNA interferase RelE/StbE